MTLRALPDGSDLIGASPSFDTQNLPDKLLSDHRLAAGVFGRLTVAAGSLKFISALPEEPERQLSAGQSHIILPEEPHRVEPGEGMQFQIEFFRPATV